MNTTLFYRDACVSCIAQFRLWFSVSLSSCLSVRLRLLEDDHCMLQCHGSCCTRWVAHTLVCIVRKGLLWSSERQSCWSMLEQFVQHVPTSADILTSIRDMSHVKYVFLIYSTHLISTGLTVIIGWLSGCKEGILYIIRTASCCVMYNSCAQWYAHKYEQFLNWCLVRVGLDFVFF